MKYRYFLLLAIMQSVLGIGIGWYSYSIGKFSVLIVALLFVVLIGVIINIVLYLYFRNLSRPAKD